MTRFKAPVNQLTNCFPYVIPADQDGNALAAQDIGSVLWSLYQDDGTPLLVDQPIAGPDADGRWMAVVLPQYNDLPAGVERDERAVVFRITYAATIDGVNYTGLTASVEGRYSIRAVTGA